MEKMLHNFDLPTRLENFPHTPEEILAVTKLDKKMESGKIKFILLKSLGEAYITKELTEQEILAGISYLINIED